MRYIAVAILLVLVLACSASAQVRISRFSPEDSFDSYRSVGFDIPTRNPYCTISLDGVFNDEDELARVGVDYTKRFTNLDTLRPFRPYTGFGWGLRWFEGGDQDETRLAFSFLVGTKLSRSFNIEFKVDYVDDNLGGSYWSLGVLY